MDEWRQSASVLHSNGDALDIAVKDGGIAGVRGRAEDRLTKPLVRKGSELSETLRDETMERVVEESNKLLDEKGPLARKGLSAGRHTTTRRTRCESFSTP